MSRSMVRVPARGLFSLILVAALSVATSAQARDRIDKLIANLKSGGDFRVRTQAALALGASKSKRAINPLCHGLGDSSRTVRTASAAALGKLRLGGETCLKERLKRESSSGVKSAIKKALSQLEDEGPSITTTTKVYLAIGKISDKTGRKKSEIPDLVRSAIKKAVSSQSGYAIAPEKETVKDAKQLLKKYSKTKALYLSPKVMKPSYSGGNLSVKVEVAVFTYPGKALKGSVPVKLTQQDVGGEDRGAEDELIQMAAERAVEKLSKNVERFQ